VKAIGTIAVFAAAAVFALAGCGEKQEPPTTGPVVPETTTTPTSTGQATTGGGGGKPATDEELIRTTIQDFLTVPNDPSVCDELITPGFLRAAYGNRQGCIAARRPAALADQVAILARKPGPKGSTIVTVKPQGGVFDAQTLKVTLVKMGGEWRIDKITSNVKIGP
jgi:predicted small lipoprotein YifL